MSPAVPKTMRTLVAPKKCLPAEYDVIEVPVPSIKRPTEVLIRMHACGIQTGDTQIAAGFPLAPSGLKYPLQLGIEGSGVIVAIGSAVTRFKPGDAVYGMYYRLPLITSEGFPGWCSDYAVGDEDNILHKPPHLSYEEAAALTGHAITAYQSFKRAVELLGSDDLAGKTVFIPGALSGTGAVGLYVAKHVFRAERIVSTVSTAKIPLVGKHLPVGLVDQLIDYKTQKLDDHVAKGSVDVVYNTQWDTMTTAIPLLDPKNGVLVTIAAIPPSRLTKMLINTPWWMNWLLDLFQLWYAFLLRGTNIKYEMISGNPLAREDMEKMGEAIAAGKVHAVMTVASLDDIEAVRKGCGHVRSGKGGLGKLVIKIT